MAQPPDVPQIQTKSPPPKAGRTPWAWACGTFFGIGLIGKGGGTVTSVVTAALWFAAAGHLQLSTANLAILTLMAAALAILVGIPAGTIVAREIGAKDPSEVVVDEVAGQLIALIAAPTYPLSWKYALVSLVLFRLFDIFKPPPVRQFESLPAGTGIMMDDVAAGLYALLIVQALHHFHAF